MGDKERLYFHDGTYIEMDAGPAVTEQQWLAHLARCAGLIAEEQERLIAAVRCYNDPSMDEETTSVCREILFWLREYQQHRTAVLKRIGGSVV